MENYKFVVYQTVDNDEYYLNWNGTLVNKNDFGNDEEIAIFSSALEAVNFVYDVYQDFGELADDIEDYFLDGVIKIIILK